MHINTYSPHHHHHHRFNVRFRPERRHRVFTAHALVGRFPEIPPLRRALSCTSLLSSPSRFLSSSTPCLQVFLPLPLPSSPSTSSSLHFDTHFSLGIRSTWTVDIVNNRIQTVFH